MKKTIVMVAIMALACTAVNAEPCPIKEGKKAPCAKQMQKPQISAEMKAKMDKKKAEFDKKLNLSEEQKAKAEAIRKQGHEEMKPIAQAMKQKHDTINEIRKNDALTQGEARAKIEPLKKELGELHKKAADLRKKNMQEFESILTEKQKNTLEKMKQEGRKEFGKNQRAKHSTPHRPMPLPLEEK